MASIAHPEVKNVGVTVANPTHQSILKKSALIGLFRLLALTHHLDRNSLKIVYLDERHPACHPPPI